MEKQYDLIVIGAGPGGYAAAVRAAKLGMKTAIVENRELGGTCLNRGCIPTKSLIHSAQVYSELCNAHVFGITSDMPVYNLEQIYKRKDEVVTKMRNGIASLLKNNKVEVFQGKAVILDEQTVQVKADTTQNLITKKILIATGSKPIRLPLDGALDKHIYTSDELLAEPINFHKLVIIGGGVIGIEFAGIYEQLGCEVELIEAMDRILSPFDKELSQGITMNLKKKGVRIHTEATVTRFEKTADRAEGEIRVFFQMNEKEESTVADAVLVAVGRRPEVEGLFAGQSIPEMNRGRINVNERFETSVKGIYAIGDVIGGMQLAHEATAQGIAAAEYMAGLVPTTNLSIIPTCVYSTPEIASVGMTQEQAKVSGIDFQAAKYPMLGNSRTMIEDGERGFIKILYEKETGKLLGAHLLCNHATDLIGEFVTGMVNNLTIAQMGTGIRPHPTYEEGVAEVFHIAVEEALSMR